MTENFHRPTRIPNEMFEKYAAGADPAEARRIAHETAAALVARVRQEPTPEILERLVSFTDHNGIDAIAELWSQARPESLPGSLWRIYLIRAVIRQDPAGASRLFERGAEALRGIDPLVAGAGQPTGPQEILDLADQILRGVFDGDLAIALERAAAYCRVCVAGATVQADEDELIRPERATAFTRRALRYHSFAEELQASARLWRQDSLD